MQTVIRSDLKAPQSVRLRTRPIRAHDTCSWDRKRLDTKQLR